MGIQTYTEKYDFREMGKAYINGINSNNSNVEFYVNFLYDEEFGKDVFNPNMHFPRSGNIEVVRAGLEGFVKGIMFFSGRVLVPLHEENWLGYFAVDYNRPSQKELMRELNLR